MTAVIWLLQLSFNLLKSPMQADGNCSASPPSCVKLPDMTPSSRSPLSLHHPPMKKKGSCVFPDMEGVAMLNEEEQQNKGKIIEKDRDGC